MNEHQLISRLRDIDAPVDISPGFAEELFRTLTLERRRQSQRRIPVARPQMLRMATASVAILVILGIGFAFFGSRPGPAVTPLITPSTHPSATPSTDPSAVPSVTPSQASPPSGTHVPAS